jgi:OmpR family response regulator RpaB
MYRVLLIDDDVRLAGLLEQFFQRYNITLESCVRPSEGLARLNRDGFDLVILDVMLPEMDGFEVCKQIRRESSIPILMLTARGDVMDRVVGLELGADDYLPKPFEPRELVARIQSILKRTSHHGSSGSILDFGDLTIDTAARNATIGGEAINLSTMEYQLLALFADAAGTVLSRDEILNRLKGIDADIYTRSVDILVSRLRHKLAPLELIKTVRGQGYLFTGHKQ